MTTATAATATTAGSPRATSRTRADAARVPAATARPRLVPVPDVDPPLETGFPSDSLTWDRPPAVAALAALAATGATSTTSARVVQIRRTDATTRRQGAAEPAAAPPRVGPVGEESTRRGPVRPAPARPAGTPRPGRRTARPAAPAERLTSPLPHQRPGGPVRHRGFRVAVVSAASVPGWSRETDVGVRMTSTLSLPPAGSAGPALARGLVEVLTGRRPMQQLRPHCAPDVYAGLADAPMLGGGGARLVTSVVCEPADGVAEVSAIFRSGDHVRAMALRLEGLDGRWRITALQLG